MRRYVMTCIALLSAAISTAAQPKMGSHFKDCVFGCPAMVVVPSGSALLDSTEADTTREGVKGEQWVNRDKPQYTVHIAKPAEGLCG